MRLRSFVLIATAANVGHACQHPGNQLAMFSQRQLDGNRLALALLQFQVKFGQVAGNASSGPQGCVSIIRPPKLPSRETPTTENI
jgi:hypothetical protein